MFGAPYMGCWIWEWVTGEEGARIGRVHAPAV